MAVHQVRATPCHQRLKRDHEYGPFGQSATFIPVDVHRDGGLRVGHIHTKCLLVAIPEPGEMALRLLPGLDGFPSQEKETRKMLEARQDPILQVEDGPGTANHLPLSRELEARRNRSNGHLQRLAPSVDVAMQGPGAVVAVMSRPGNLRDLSIIDPWERQPATQV